MASASERRSTRNRVYTLVGGSMVVLISVAALTTFRHLAEHRISADLYAHPHLTLVALAEAQERYSRELLAAEGKPRYATSLSELEQAGYITDNLATGKVEGYHYVMLEVTPQTWAMTASPIDDPAQLHYYVDHTHVVRAARGGPAGPTSEVFLHPLHGRVWDETSGEQPAPSDVSPSDASPSDASSGSVSTNHEEGTEGS
jgi:hypothetical protein